jgi:hypothetical protein
MHYLAYLDEFGHIGPFVSRQDPRFKESPVFGLGGMVLPAERVRGFATWFYQLKNTLLAWEIARSGVPAYQWEKKGAALYTTTNVHRYRHIGRVGCYRARPDEFPEMDWTSKYFLHRLNRVALRSGIRLERQAPAMTAELGIY